MSIIFEDVLDYLADVPDDEDFDLRYADPLSYSDSTPMRPTRTAAWYAPALPARKLGGPDHG